MSILLRLLSFLLIVSAVHSAAADDAVPRQPDSKALAEFLRRFDPICERGFVRTMRSGSTGIGYTLESLLHIRENNSPQGDLLGMEIKAYRDQEERSDDHAKMNLFLKEPVWKDSFSTADRIRTYGYTDDEGNPAWYQSVTIRPNSSGLALDVQQRRKLVRLMRNGKAIGHWTFDILQQRLSEKLSETVFVAAESRGSGRDEEFHFRTVTYCAEPSVTSFLKLIRSGDIILELRMHVKPTGAARNHGTAFRIRKHRIADLYAIQQQCRPRPVAD